MILSPEQLSEISEVLNAAERHLMDYDIMDRDDFEETKKKIEDGEIDEDNADELGLGDYYYSRLYYLAQDYQDLLDRK